LIKIHTLKGLSATIGAVALNKIVAKLYETRDETLIVEVKEELKVVLEELSSVFIDD
jgi:HPt (histidine-containing phosphotransfer) domain-containing protein